MVRKNSEISTQKKFVNQFKNGSNNNPGSLQHLKSMILHHLVKFQVLVPGLLRGYFPKLKNVCSNPHKILKMVI